MLLSFPKLVRGTIKPQLNGVEPLAETAKYRVPSIPSLGLGNSPWI